ncbi:GntR family transcriptional regulator [Ensifer sp. YR511]|uniref:GntR family transcriptional regulator n=1 Tax=Ensifer sp. YR511 TaxID=1855294 RepID=UPI00088B35FA|nr:GntR family transcriptional regulator [Ensifer sp. YR511]SDN34739.1 DNA-binding transcriptional regulator, GntR family [Ensifer sp. YR511]
MTALERPKSLTERVCDELLTSIMDGTIPFGRLLSEKALASQYGTSKTPVREAFVSLQSLGLVEVLPQKGCLVFCPTIKQVEELCEVRIILESAAIRFSMAHRKKDFLEKLQQAHLCAQEKAKSGPVKEYNAFDDGFHEVFFACCDNEALRSAYDLFRPRIQTLRINLQSTHSYLIAMSVDDHGEIVERLKAEQVEEAIALVSVHVRRMSNAYASNWAQLMKTAPEP